MRRETTKVRSGKPGSPQRTGVRKKMQFGQGALWMTAICGFLAAARTQEAGSVSFSTSIQVTAEALAAQPVGANWRAYHGDYAGRRFSSLEQINAKSVGQLRAQWVFHAPNSNSLEVTPVVLDGLMFVTSANDAYALDAQTGRVIWHYSRPVTEGLIDDASQHRSEEHTSELQSQSNLVCRLLLEKKKKQNYPHI